MNNAASANLTTVLSQTPLHCGFTLNGKRVLPATGEVFLPEGVQTLEPKVMAVLLVLVRAMGQLVSAEQIFAEVWPRSIYSPIAVRRSVNQLRNLFSDADKSLIRTHPKRGYSLHAHIETQPAIGPTLIEDPQSPRIATTSLQVQAIPAIVKARRLKPIGWTGLITALCILVPGLWWLWSAPVNQSQSWQVSDLQPLTASAAPESFSQFTPDNNAVVYLKHPDEPGVSSELWLATLDRRQHRLLYQSDRQITFFAFAPGLMATAAGTTALLIATEQAGKLQFSNLPIANTKLSDQPVAAEDILLKPDALFSLADSRLHSPFFTNNNQLYFLARQQGDARLYRADLATGQLSLLLAPTDQFRPYRIAPAPDQSRIAVLGFDQQQRSQIKLLSTDTAVLTDYLTLDANWYFLTYHQAARGYLLSDGKALFYLDAVQQLRKVIFENYAHFHYPALSPDGRHISYTQTNISGNLFSLPLAGGQPQQLTSSSRHDWQGSFSADNRQLAYVSNKNGYSQIFVKDLQTQQERLVYANPDQHLALSQPVWSADGEHLAFARNQRLVIVKLGDAKPQHFDSVIGQPTQWLGHPARVLLKQPAQPANRWLLFDVASAQQQSLVASNQDQLFVGQQWFQADAQQLTITREPATGPATGAETGQDPQSSTSTVLFQAGANQQIRQLIAKADGIYLLLTDKRPQTQPALAQASVWFLDVADRQMRKLADIPMSGREISDITSHQVLYSTFSTEKDIHTLRFSQH